MFSSIFAILVMVTRCPLWRSQFSRNSTLAQTVHSSCLGLLTPLFLIATSPAVNGAFVIANATADTFLSSANAASNYGGGGALSVASGSLARGEFQSLIRFDLSGVKNGFDAVFGPGNWVVQSAVLQLNREAPVNPLFNPSAAGQLGFQWMANTAWVEGTGTPGAPSATGANFNSLPTLISGADQSLGTFSFNGATSGAASFSFTLSSGLVGSINSGGVSSLRILPLDATVSALFSSRTNATVADRPQFIIEAIAVPEPSSLALIAIAAVGFGLRTARWKGIGTRHP